MRGHATRRRACAWEGAVAAAEGAIAPQLKERTTTSARGCGTNGPKPSQVEMGMGLALGVKASRARLEIDVARIARVKYPENLLGVAAHLSLLFGGPSPNRRNKAEDFVPPITAAARRFRSRLNERRALVCESARVYRTERRLVVFLDVVAAPRWANARVARAD